ncbi:MAG: NAD-dependent epimerase/dehydratase family protein, partial [Acidobacteria bacterium]|nr:NAD-dependent epimerase/dehydratase family protein [Acidobacteriota bacterium]
VRQACRGVGSVCHLAYLNGTEFFYSVPELVLDIGVKGAVNVIDACRAEGVKELVLASSSEVYQSPQRIPTDETVAFSIPDPLNPRYSYAAGKIISEVMAINFGRKYFERVLIFRPHNVYGPDMGWEHVIPQFVVKMKQLCRASQRDPILFPIHGTGRETRAFIFIKDFIDGLMLVLEKGEHMGIYHIGTMDEIAIKEVAEAVAHYFGRTIEVVPGKPAEGGTPRRCPDITRLRNLGFQPGVPFREGLRMTAKWYDENAVLAPHRQAGVSL